MIPRLTTSTLPSPVGPLAIAADEQGRLRGVSFGDGLTKAMRREYPRASFLEGETPAAVRDGRSLGCGVHSWGPLHAGGTTRFGELSAIVPQITVTPAAEFTQGTLGGRMVGLRG